MLSCCPDVDGRSTVEDSNNSGLAAADLAQGNNTNSDSGNNPNQAETASSEEAIERDEMTFDYLIVGAGPAGLACAIRLKQQQADASIAVLEKASQPGMHSLAGAVIETAAIDKLFKADNNWQDNPPDVWQAVTKDEFSLLSKTKKHRLPTPPQANNHGNFITSLGSLVAWLANKAENLGVEIYPGFPAQQALFDNNQVIGVRTGDMGRDKSGQMKDGFAPGMDLKANVTIFAEGCRGSVSKQLIEHYQLDQNSQPQTYGIGLKELWQLKPGTGSAGLVQHSIGWPLDTQTYGGSFAYHLPNDQLAIGFVVGLDYQDPNFSPFEAFQQFKHHPSVKPLLEGGEIISAGARALVEGGWQSLPKLDMPGAMLIGDAAGTLNVPKIKGIHTAMWSGIYAADHLAETGSAKGWNKAFRQSDVAEELKRERNIRPGFQRGLWYGLINAAWQTVTKGKLSATRRHHADHEATRKLSELAQQERDWMKRDLAPRDRLASVYFAATEHDEDQPVHLQISDPDICTSRCAEEYGNPCTKFCPANVYEMVNDNSGNPSLQINSANCVHCKTCDIKDPYQIINWVPPEGGSGPNYRNL